MAERLSTEILSAAAIGKLPERTSGVLLADGGDITYVGRDGATRKTTLSPGTIIRGVERIISASAPVSALSLPQGYAPGEVINRTQTSDTPPDVADLDAGSLGTETVRITWLGRPGWFTRVEYSRNEGSTWRFAGIAAAGSDLMDLILEDLVVAEGVTIRVRHQSAAGLVAGVYATVSTVAGIPLISNFSAEQATASSVTVSWTANAAYRVAVDYRVHSTLTGEVTGWTSIPTTAQGASSLTHVGNDDLENGMIYSFRGRFTDLTVFSSAYREDSVVAVNTVTGDNDPTDLAVDVDGLSVVLDWVAPTRGINYAKYRIERRLGTEAFALVHTSAIGAAAGYTDTLPELVLSPTYRLTYFWADGSEGTITASTSGGGDGEDS